MEDKLSNAKSNKLKRSENHAIVSRAPRKEA